MDNIKKRRLKISLTVVGFLILSFFVCFTPSLELIFSRPFDSAKWKSGSEFTRGMMARNLSESHLLIGKSRGEIEKLLGKPDFSNNEKLDYSIDFGARVFFSKWQWHLIVRIDESGNVNEVTMED